MIGSICAGAFILTKLGLLENVLATTHPDAKTGLQALGVETVDKPLVCNGNVATAGGCLSAIYLVGWFVERLYNTEKRRETLREIIPAGQNDIYEQLITLSIQEGMQFNKEESVCSLEAQAS